jgi:hypothetical protein
MDRVRLHEKEQKMRILLAVSICLAAYGTAFAQPTADKADGIKVNYREVIQGLASPNKPIVIADNHNDRLNIPPGYDMEVQKQIEDKRRLLYEKCEEALPFIIEACTDPRYSLTWKSDSYTQNVCVGEVCLEIIAAHLEVYREYMTTLGDKGRYYGYRFVPRINGAIGAEVTQEEKKKIEDWWRGRKDKTLLELQIEAFDWAIEKRRNDFERPYDKSEATADIERLVAARDKLKQDRKCLPPGYIPPSVNSSRINASDK